MPEAAERAIELAQAEAVGVCPDIGDRAGGSALRFVGREPVGLARARKTHAGSVGRRKRVYSREIIDAAVDETRERSRRGDDTSGHSDVDKRELSSSHAFRQGGLIKDGPAGIGCRDDDAADPVGQGAHGKGPHFSCPNDQDAGPIRLGEKTKDLIHGEGTDGSTDSCELRAPTERSAKTERPLEDPTQDGVERRRGRSERRPYLAANLWLALHRRVEAGRDLEEVADGVAPIQRDQADAHPSAAQRIDLSRTVVDVGGGRPGEIHLHPMARRENDAIGPPAPSCDRIQ
jgi:hypothetical protein